MFRTFATAALLALTIGTAQAGPFSLQFGDLNLSNAADARILASRAHSLAEEVCADWKPDMWQKNSFYVNRFYMRIYDSCIDTTSHRLTTRAMAKSAARATHFASN